MTEKEWREAQVDGDVPAGVPGRRAVWISAGGMTRRRSFRCGCPMSGGCWDAATILVPPPDGQLLLDDVKRALVELHERNPISLLVMDISDARDVHDFAENELGLDVEVRDVGTTSQIADYTYFMEALTGRRVETLR